MNEKYQRQLLQCKNYRNFLSMFFGLGLKEQLSIFGIDYTISKGTKLYRIRKDDGKTDFNNEKEWLPPPIEKIRQGRFNEKNEQILYTALSEYCLEREVALKQGESYYLATYICKKDFSVGSFLNDLNQISSIIHCVAKAIENTNCFNQEELEQYQVFKRMAPIDIFPVDMYRSFYIHEEINNLYNVTNKIGRLIKYSNGNGIRYCSAFDPFEVNLPGKIFTLNGLDTANIALTPNGFSNIKFIGAEHKTATLEHSLDVFFGVMNEIKEEK